jgi:(1->4)-alpha-D-glucan 1-alpha-D-glucosylmutase
MPDVAAKPVPMRPGAIPRATYRLQFQRGFTLRDALGLVPYLADLGVSHLYASPLLKACPGSAHGYDVCDPSQLNPEIGGDADLGALVEALFERGMGLVLDLVPNHMGIQCPENRWWWDVLRHGRASRYAGHFDIDWESSDPGLRGRVLVPVLGDAYPRVLERGELKLEQRQGAFSLRYYEHAFPLSPESESALLRRAGPGEALVELNASPAALGELIELQHYRLAWWRLGDERLNYRRCSTTCINWPSNGAGAAGCKGCASIIPTA